jgi:hypothetical protein
MDLSDMLATGQSTDKPTSTQINRYRVLGAFSNFRSTENDPNSEDEEEQSDESEQSALEESDSDEDDGQLEKLGAFVDSLSSKVQQRQPEPDTDAPLPAFDGNT